MREGEELLARGDYVQASEKAWGAASQIVKAVAARRGLEAMEKFTGKSLRRRVMMK